MPAVLLLGRSDPNANDLTTPAWDEVTTWPENRFLSPKTCVLAQHDELDLAVRAQEYSWSDERVEVRHGKPWDKHERDGGRRQARFSWRFSGGILTPDRTSTAVRCPGFPGGAPSIADQFPGLERHGRCKSSGSSASRTDTIPAPFNDRDVAGPGLQSCAAPRRTACPDGWYDHGRDRRLVRVPCHGKHAEPRRARQRSPASLPWAPPWPRPCCPLASGAPPRPLVSAGIISGGFCRRQQSAVSRSTCALPLDDERVLPVFGA